MVYKKVNTYSNWFNENGDEVTPCRSKNMEWERISPHYKMLSFDSYDLQLLKDAFINEKVKWKK